MSHFINASVATERGESAAPLENILQSTLALKRSAFGSVQGVLPSLKSSLERHPRSSQPRLQTFDIGNTSDYNGRARLYAVKDHGSVFRITNHIDSVNNCVYFAYVQMFASLVLSLTSVQSLCHVGSSGAQWEGGKTLVSWH